MARGDHQLFHNKPSYFEGAFKLFYCYSKLLSTCFVFYHNFLQLQLKIQVVPCT